MPSYKTHAIQGELILPEVNLRVDLDKDDFRMFCLGPDALAPINTGLFKLNHCYNTKEFLLSIIEYIKVSGLQDNPEVMAFLYGQLEHFVLDLIIHPLIFYMTEGMPRESIVNGHGLVEHLIDDYVMHKYKMGKGNYFKKIGINYQETYDLINYVYERVYNVSNVGIQYASGILMTKFYDGKIRGDKTNIIKSITDLFNLGDIKYHKNYKLAYPYLNLEHNVWLNPETGYEYNLSFDDLWVRANELLLDLIEDVNNYLYRDIPFNNTLVMSNLSYLTGLPCEFGQTKKYYKKY